MKRSDSPVPDNEPTQGDEPTEEVSSGVKEASLGDTALLQLVIDNIPQYIFWKDRRSVYLGCNRNFAKAAGFESPEEVVGRTDFDMAWNPEEAEFFRAVDQRVMTSGEPAYHIIEPQLQADGKQAWLDTNKIPLRDSDDEVVGILGTFEDITEQRDAALALEEREASLSATLNAIAEGVLATNAWGYIVRMNPVAEKLTGYSFKRAHGRSLKSIYATAVEEGGDARDVVSLVRRGENATNVGPVDVRLTARDGSVLLIAETAAALKDEQGEFQGVVVVFRDVTEQRKLSEQLRHAQKMDSIGQLAGGVAHDFNNMLTGILGASGLLRRGLDNDRQRALLDVIIRSAQRAADLTSKLLAFSRRGRLETRGIDLHSLIRDVATLLERSIAKNIELVLELNANPCIVSGDPSELQTALLNLTINARDAMPDGGRLVITTEYRMLDAEECAAHPFELRPGPFVHLSFRDTGSGMSPYVLARVFEPFFTTKPQGAGTGLGLAAVYGVIQEHGGAIECESTLGEGSTFRLLLPAANRRTMSGSYDATTLTTGAGRVLVVDDEELVRTGAQLLLEQLGYTVELAGDGLEALEVVAKTEKPFDAILLDIVMPRLDGHGCLARLREVAPDVPVIMTSGFTRDAIDIDTHGVAGFLKKPYRLEQVAETVSAVLAASQMAAAQGPEESAQGPEES